MPESPTLFDASDPKAWDDWLKLFASRDEVVEEYHLFLHVDGPDWPYWEQLNEAIIRRWSVSGLLYIKWKAWTVHA